MYGIIFITSIHSYSVETEIKSHKNEKKILRGSLAKISEKGNSARGFVTVPYSNIS